MVNIKKRAVIFSGLVNVDRNLVGTAVIYKKIAEIFLKQSYQVVMVIPEKTDLAIKGIDFVVYNDKNNKKVINDAGVIVFGAYPPNDPLIYAHKKHKIIMTYLWSIAPIGSLEFKDFKEKEEQIKLHRFISSSYNLSLLLSDKIFCRDENIRKLVLGSLISLGRVNLENYQKDKSFKRLVEAAPFGVEKAVAKKHNILYRGIIPGINKDDFILLWNGGIWNWNDGETLVKVMFKLKKENIKLVFQGFKHPGKGQSLSQAATKCFNLAKKLKLKDKNIFFLDTWVPYDRREDFLLEADLGIVSSPDIPEANLFLKTRIYDHLWAELPTVLNGCEAFAEVIYKNNLGLISQAKNVDSWVKNILLLKNNPRLLKEIKNNIKKYKQNIYWSETLKPISDFIKHPYRAEDKDLSSE